MAEYVATRIGPGIVSFVDLPVGTYEVTVEATGYVTQTFTAVVEEGMVSTYTVTMTPLPEGTLSVDTEPVKGEVFVDGVSWGIAPQSRVLPAGTYTVSFGDVTGYITPTSQSVAVVADLTTSITATYVELPPEEGTLSITTVPVNGEVFVNGASWGVAPQSRVLVVGTYDVSFGPVSGYVTPSPESATVYPDTVTSVLGTYVPIVEEGTLYVDTTPIKGEIFVDGVSWGIAPQSRTLPTGTYTVSFGDVSGYRTPVQQQATVITGQTTSLVAQYIELVTRLDIAVDKKSGVLGDMFVFSGYLTEDGGGIDGVTVQLFLVDVGEVASDITTHGGGYMMGWTADREGTLVFYAEAMGVTSKFITVSVGVVPPPCPAHAAYMPHVFHPDLIALRKFRDRFIPDGIVKLYYKYSRLLTPLITDRDKRKLAIRRLLKPIVELAKCLCRR